MECDRSFARPAVTAMYRSILAMDAGELDAFRRALRRRYGREELLDELRSCACRLGRTPTMREFAADPEAAVHPHTLVEHFGSWIASQRAAGLRPRRNASRDELTVALAELGRQLGRRPTTRDIERARGRLPGKSVYVKAFGSISAALAAAGFGAMTTDERLERSVNHAADVLARTGRMPSFRAWDRIRDGREDVMSAWQIYRAFERVPTAIGGAWAAFQLAVAERARLLPAAVA